MAGNETSFSIDIDANADSAEAAAAQVETLAERLAQAGEASSAASAAVAAAEKAYAQQEATADRATKALEKLNIALADQQSKMQAAAAAGDDLAYAKAASAAEKLAQRQSEAASAAEKAKTSLAAEAASLDKLKASAAAAADNESTLKKAHEAATKKAEALADAEDKAAGSGNFKELADGAKKLGGPLGKVAGVAGEASEGLNKLTESVGAAGGVYVAAAAAVVALFTAFAAGTAAVLKWSVGLADANRSAQLLSDGIAGTVAGGRELDATIKSLEKRVPQTSDELKSMAADLAKTGLKGQALTDALEDAATKAAQLKWGPDFAKGAISLDKLTTRLTSNISGVFGGLNIEGVLKGLSSIVDLFDSASTTGKAMKVVFESIFQPLVDSLSDLAPMIVKTFIQLEIWALKGLIAIKPYGSIIMQVVKGFGVLAAIVGVALGAVVVNLVAMGVALAAAAGAVVWLVTQVIALVNWFNDLSVAIVNGVVEAFGSLKEMFGGLADISLVDIGTQIIAGLAQGITNGGAAVLSAIGGVVTGAIDSAKGLLGIHSPSKVFAEIGSYTAEGMAGGVESGTSQVQGSLESMVSPPQPAAAEPADSAGSGSGGGTVININVAADGGDAPSIAAAVREAVLDLFEGGVVQVGRGVPA